MSSQTKLTEGLRAGDLKNMISHNFTIDQYKSKIGEDENTVVLAFQINDRFATVDVMEFIEKSYNFVLDADMSPGEERDSTYRLFIEIERTSKVIDQIFEILAGLSRLCGIDQWKFKYQKETTSYKFTSENATEHIPLSQTQYQEYLIKIKEKFVSEVINQGSATITEYNQNDQIVVTRPFAQPLAFQVEAMGSYKQVVDQFRGAVQLDEHSASEVLFLEKFLGNQNIHKINNKFIIQNGDIALAVSMIR